jgi:uncharacterized OB-fold protein
MGLCVDCRIKLEAKLAEEDIFFEFLEAYQEKPKHVGEICEHCGRLYYD